VKSVESAPVALVGSAAISDVLRYRQRDRANTERSSGGMTR